jgi:hypothetical protein
MMQKLFSILLVLSYLFGQHAVIGVTCEEFQSRIDRLNSVDSLVNFLSIRFLQQSDVEDLMVCLGTNMTQRLPTEIIQNYTNIDLKNRTFIYGNGYGSALAARLIPFWNRFQRLVVRIMWTGKILQVDPVTNTVSLYNVMSIFRSMLYYAEVYNKVSMMDGFDAIVLDYRKDTNDLIKTIRDEIREVTYRGVRTGIYLGRAYLFNGPNSDLMTDAWDDKTKYSFSANFMLDFREQNQNNIPQWALRNYVS